MTLVASGTLTSLGGKSKTTFLFSDPDSLNVELTANAAIKDGQPIKLTTDGKAAVWANTDGVAALLGYAYGDTASGELLTVITRGVALIYGISAGADQDAGAVTNTAYDSSTDIGGCKGYSKYAISADATKIQGWALDAAEDANELIRIVLAH